MSTTCLEQLLEIEEEVKATGRLLERIPAGKLGWKPHPRSMSLGQLALHVATIPSAVAAEVRTEGTDAGSLVQHPEPQSMEEIREAWARNLSAVQDLGADGDDGTWSVTGRGKALLTLPKKVARRLLMLNHWYHHRGQLTVYLRLLDVPLPPVYGPSADENPFAG